MSQQSFQWFRKVFFLNLFDLFQQRFVLETPRVPEFGIIKKSVNAAQQSRQKARKTTQTSQKMTTTSTSTIPSGVTPMSQYQGRMFNHKQFGCCIVDNGNSKERKAIFLSKRLVFRFLATPQHEAARQLGVSVATLKRKCREWNIHWPKTKNQRLKSQTLIKMHVQFITCDEEAISEKYLDAKSVQALRDAFNISCSASRMNTC